MKLHIGAGSSEPWLLVDAISTKIKSAGSHVVGTRFLLIDKKESKCYVEV